MDDWRGQLVAEYEAYTAGRLDAVRERVPLEQGELHYCRALDGQDCWAIVFVDADGEVVMPLAVGPLARATKALQRLGEGPRLWDRSRYRPPSVIAAGRRHYFRPTKGAHLVGVADVGTCVVLLEALGEELAVVRVEGTAMRVLYVGRPEYFAELNVDRLLSFDHAAGATEAERTRSGAAGTRTSKSSRAAKGNPPPAKTARPSVATAAHHERILEGVPVEPDAARRVERVLRFGFADIARRTTEAQVRSGKKRRGAQTVPMLLEMFCELAIRGVGDFGGRVGAFAARIRLCFPGREFTDYAFGCALRLILATGTSVLTLVGYTWRLHIQHLRNPASAEHRKFCEETCDGYVEAAPLEPPSPAPSGEDGTGTRAAGADAANDAGDREAPTAVEREAAAAAERDPARPSSEDPQRDEAANSGAASAATPAPGEPQSATERGPEAEGAGAAAATSGTAQVFASGFSLGVLFCYLALFGEDQAAPARVEAVVGEPGAADDAPRTSEPAAADERNAARPDDKPTELDEGKHAEASAAKFAADEMNAAEPSDADVGGEVPLGPAQVEGDAPRASAGVDDEGRDVSDAASEAVDELNATGPASADVGDNGQLGQVPVEGDDAGPGQAQVEGDTPSVSDEVSACEAGEIAQLGTVPFEDDTAGPDGTDASDEVQPGQVPVEGDAVGSKPGDTDMGDEGQLGKVPFEDDTAVPGRTDVSDEVQLGQARVEGDAPSAGPSDPASDGIEVSEAVSAFETGEYADPTSAQPADAADELNAAGPGDTAAGDDVQLGHAQVEGDTPTPQWEHLGTLGPRGPPRSRS